MKISKFTFKDLLPMKIGEEFPFRNGDKEVRGIVTNCVLVKTASGMNFYEIEVKLDEPIEVSDYKQECAVFCSL